MQDQQAAMTQLWLPGHVLIDVMHPSLFVTIREVIKVDT